MTTAHSLREQVTPLLKSPIDHLDDLAELFANPEEVEGPRPWTPSRYEPETMPGIAALWDDVAKVAGPLLTDAKLITRIKALQVAVLTPSTHWLSGLVRCLSDEDWTVRSMAADLLGDIGASETVDALISRIDDKHDAVRLSAVAALGQIGDARAIDALEVAFDNDEDGFVRRWAAQSMGEIGTPVAVDILVAGLGAELVDALAEEGIRTGLAAAGDSAVDSLAELLDANDERVRSRAYNTLVEIGTDRAVALLQKELPEADEDLTIKVNAALAQRGDANSIARLQALMMDETEWWVALPAAGELLKLGNGTALTRLLVSYFSAQRGPTARQLLQEIPDALVEELELTLTAVSDINIRRAACDVVGLQKFRSLKDTLAELADHENPELALAAWVNLARLGDDTSGQRLADLFESIDDHLERIRLFVSMSQLERPIPLQMVLPTLGDPSATIVIGAFDLVEEDDDDDAIGRALVSVLKQEHMRLTEELPARSEEQNTSLSDKGFQEALRSKEKYILEALPDELRPMAKKLGHQSWTEPSVAVARTAAQLLANYPVDDALDALRPFLKADNPMLRFEALLSLLRLTGPEELEQHQLQQDSSPIVRYLCFAAHINGEHNVQFGLEGLATDSASELRQVAVEFLEDEGDAGRALLKQLTNDDNKKVAKKAKAALESLSQQD